MTLEKCLFINNDCYKTNRKMTNGKPVGIVVHSTGCNNKTLKRYVQPVKGQENYDTIMNDIGKNIYGNHWNRSASEMGQSSCVHAFIGVNAKGQIKTYQVLPFNICCWGIGAGQKGSYNFNPTAHIQFEICEDELNNESYFSMAMKEAQEFCAYLCQQYELPVSSICSHYEAYQRGYGCGHVDPQHWLTKFGYTMDWFRECVSKLLEPKRKTIYRVQVGAFLEKTNAQRMKDELSKLGYDGYIIRGEI